MNDFVNIAQEELSSGKIQGKNFLPSLTPSLALRLALLCARRCADTGNTVIKIQAHTTVPAFVESTVQWGKTAVN